MARPFDELTQQQQAFVQLRAEGVPRDIAYQKAGYAGAGTTLSANARKLERQLSENIHTALLERLATGLPLCISQALQLVESAESEAVRLNAIKYVAALGGLDVEQKISLTTRAEDMPTDAVTRELEKLLGKARTEAAEPSVH